MPVTEGTITKYEDSEIEKKVLIVEVLSDKTAREQVIGYDYNKNEKTLDEEYPEYNPDDTPVKCVYISQIDSIPATATEVDTKTLEEIQNKINANKLQPYYFHKTRLE
jgi:hypothetical protein